MKNILCYGDSNTWGQIAGSMDMTLRLARRYEYGIRWTSVLQQLLGSDYRIIEAGLNGRSTSFDEPNSTRPSRNGLAALPLVMDMNYPLDLVIIMLGTNDTRLDIDVSIERIMQGVRQLIQSMKSCQFGPNLSAPQVLLMAPAPITSDSKIFPVYDASSIAKSQQFSELYKKLADQEQCYFLDIAPTVKIDSADGVHITRDSHQRLAEAIAARVKKIQL